MEWITEIITAILSLIVGFAGGGAIGYKIGIKITVNKNSRIQKQKAGNNSSQTQIGGNYNDR